VEDSLELERTGSGDSDRNFWMSAEEAKAYGLVDKIITSRSEIE